MQPSTNQDYKQLLTEVIKKQIVILGPDITLSKARNVKGLNVADDGTVTAVEGNSQAVTQALIDQFVQLSGLIVKKTMEPLLSLSQETPTISQPLQAAPTPIAQPVVTAAEPTPAPQPVPTPTQPMPAGPQVQAPVSESAQPIAQPTAQPAQPASAASNPQTNTNPAPANNPLAA